MMGGPGARFRVYGGTLHKGRETSATEDPRLIRQDEVEFDSLFERLTGVI